MREIVVGSAQRGRVERRHLSVRLGGPIELPPRREQWLEVAALQVVSAATMRPQRSQGEREFTRGTGASDDVASGSGEPPLTGEDYRAITEMEGEDSIAEADAPQAA